VTLSPGERGANDLFAMSGTHSRHDANREARVRHEALPAGAAPATRGRAPLVAAPRLDRGGPGRDRLRGELRLAILGARAAPCAAVRSILTAERADELVGDASKARQRLGWRPEISFQALVKEMVASDLKAVAMEAWRKDRGHY
jgi:hypothetical protein